MKRILIADANKASLVITSELFKDYYPGVQVAIAKTSADAIEAAKNNGVFDAIVVDFDLPDRDGAYTAAKIKKLVNTPILITGFDKPHVHSSIEKELSGYNDCLNWLTKPVRADTLVDIVSRYCEGKYRCLRRISCQIPALFELEVTVKENISKLKQREKQEKTKKTSTKIADVKELITTHRVMIPAQILDCSLGGVKVQVNKNDLLELKLATPVLSAIKTLEKGANIYLQLPQMDTLKQGNNPTYRDLLSQLQNQMQVADNKRDVAKAGVIPLPAMKTKVAWNKPGEIKDSFVFGMQTDSVLVAKKLFDTILAGTN